MSRFARRVAAILTAVFAVAGFALTATAAQASSTSVGTFNSQFLGGHITAGVNRITEDRVYTGALPDLNAWTTECLAKAPVGGCQSKVGIGGLIVQNTNGGEALGEAYVWDAAASDAGPVCPSDMFTLEGAAGEQSVAKGINVIDLSSLVPLDQFGGPICESPGDVPGFDAIVVSRSSFEVYYIHGASESTAVITNSPVHGVHLGMFAAGEGITVSGGQYASFLPTGTVASFLNMGLSVTQTGKPDRRVTWDLGPTWNVNSTVDGNAPSISNPETITSHGLGSSSSFHVSAP